MMKPRLLALLFACALPVMVVGQEVVCTPFDNNGDNIVGIGDLIDLLARFGDSDLDQDGIWDSADDCVGAYDTCGVCNGPGPQVLAIDTIIITAPQLICPTAVDFKLIQTPSFGITLVMTQNIEPHPVPWNTRVQNERLPIHCWKNVELTFPSKNRLTSLSLRIAIRNDDVPVGGPIVVPAVACRVHQPNHTDVVEVVEANFSPPCVISLIHDPVGRIATIRIGMTKIFANATILNIADSEGSIGMQR